MHIKAQKWDEEHGYDNQFGSTNPKPFPDGFMPKNRPCDWCGEIVEDGCIHKECQQKEAAFYLDILY